MMVRRIFALLSIIALAGCDNANEDPASKPLAEKQTDYRSAGLNYGGPQKITAPFRFAFEVSTVELCSPARTEEAPTCPDAGRHCWLEFDADANKDMDRITKRYSIAEEGTYWMEGVGRMAESSEGVGHLNQYECQVEMTKVRRFVKISD